MDVLIVEDDGSVARFLKQALEEAGYAAVVIGDGQQAVELALSRAFDAILLDVMLPHLDGFSVCKLLRQSHVATPILLITARDALADKVQGLDSGADDYIVKPFQLEEMLARLRALLRRSGAGAQSVRVGDLVLDPASRKVTRGSRTVSLSGTEYTLLEYLMRNAGRVLTRAMILEHVWEYDFGGNDNVLDVYISYLRSKLDRGQAEPLIHTVRGVGYRMDPHAD
ncbi:MAG: response regulator transcription factor [Armatimonadetes bacterium]|nr:response regulator transcription factor [Armatimonadota bacterium]MDE2206476.1 response regulator transcription factor [Armatimonadota bacterium]